MSPADIAKACVVLAQSTQEDVLAWFTAAAAAGYPEGMFFLAWCTYPRVGARPDASYARALYGMYISVIRRVGRDSTA